MSQVRAAAKVYTCHLCGKIFSRHDDGYHHWLACTKANHAKLTEAKR